MPHRGLRQLESWVGVTQGEGGSFEERAGKTHLTCQGWRVQAKALWNLGSALGPETAAPRGRAGVQPAGPVAFRRCTVSFATSLGSV